MGEYPDMPDRCPGCGRFNFDDAPTFPKVEGREREKRKRAVWDWVEGQSGPAGGGVGRFAGP